MNPDYKVEIKDEFPMLCIWLSVVVGIDLFRRRFVGYLRDRDRKKKQKSKYEQAEMDYLKSETKAVNEGSSPVFFMSSYCYRGPKGDMRRYNYLFNEALKN